MENFFVIKTDEGIRRQDAGKLYRINGALYIIDTDIIEKEMPWYGNYTYAYEMERKYSPDVDTIDDFEYVEFLINKNNR